jgi:hypothetical protein
MPYNLCITDKEVDDLIETLQTENENLDEEQVKKAIGACCLLHKNTAVADDAFILCVKEQLDTYRLIDYKHK